MPDMSQTAESAVFHASYLEPAPSHGMDFLACEAEVCRRQTAEGYVVRGTIAVEAWCRTAGDFDALEGSSCTEVSNGTF